MTTQDRSSPAHPRRLTYIAAPYFDLDPAVRAWNVARACFLARAAIAYGDAPIVVHPGISQIYGDEETPELRALGMRVDLDLLTHVHRANGGLHVLLCDDGTMSSGVKTEVEHWASLDTSAHAVGYGLKPRPPVVWSWSNLGDVSPLFGRRDEWVALRRRPSGAIV